MRIHYSTPIWHGGFHKFFSGALMSLGHDVRLFDEGGTPRERFLGRVFSRIPKYQYRGIDRVRAMVTRDWQKDVHEYRPDLIVLEHTPNIAPWAVYEAKQLAPIFYWVDSPPAGAQAQDMIASLKFATKLFTIDRTWMTILFDKKDYEFLPLAGDETIFVPKSVPESEKEYDVVFVGSMPPQSGDGYLRAAVCASVAREHKIAIFGAGADYWVRYFPELKKCIHDVRIPDGELSGLYNRTKIVLNIHSTWHFSSVSARTYEIALTGAFQLVDHRNDLDELFPKNMFATFRSAHEVPKLVGEWLKKPAEREKKALKAREHVLAHHTWRHRAEKMLTYLK